MKEGDFVYCFTEGDRIFRINNIVGDVAWLEDHVDNQGSEPLSMLTLATPHSRVQEIAIEMWTLSEELKFLTCS